ncbi:MAG: hypothetical protein WAV18_15625 [Roseiarcus sp.]
MMSANPGDGDNPSMMMKAKPTEPTVVMNGGPAMMAANPASGDNPTVMTDAKREPKPKVPTSKYFASSGLEPVARSQTSADRRRPIEAR